MLHFADIRNPSAEAPRNLVPTEGRALPDILGSLRGPSLGLGSADIPRGCCISRISATPPRSAFHGG